MILVLARQPVIASYKSMVYGARHFGQRVVIKSQNTVEASSPRPLKMRNQIILPLAFTALFGLLAASLHAAPEPVAEALPMVGTGGHGHTYPGATTPFGFVQLSPDTRTGTWDSCGGYYYPDTTIMGFSHTHISGTGCPELAELLVLPLTGPLNSPTNYQPMDCYRYQSHFSHDNELAQPGYYRVLLDKYNVLAELTATEHAGMHRYTFPASKNSHLLVDLEHAIGNRSVEASMKIENKTTITGHRRSTGWAKDKVTYFVIECSRPFSQAGLELEGKPLPAGQQEAVGKSIRCHLDYRTAAGQQIVLRVGLSPTSVEEARKNLATEIPTWDFDAVKTAAQAKWNENLSRIKIESSNPAIRQTFYSAMYHTMLAPNLYNDADGTYRGTDQKIHTGDGFQNYCTFSLWDTFRAEHPLLTLVQPERVNDFVQSLLTFDKQSQNHLLPLWPLASCETDCMIGYHAVPVIYDAYEKGFRGFDVNFAYEAMRATAMSDRNRQGEYKKLGYVPYVKGQTEATSRTLEFSYDDWCIAQMAKSLGKTDDVDLFTKRSENFKNVFDAKTQFFRSKQADGTYLEPFDPKEVSTGDVPASGYYTEANAWQYMFAVFHDVPGMMDLYGGKSAFITRLDQLFTEDSDMPHWRVDVTGIIGQYAHGNEPCHHIAYLYALAGAQYKTAERVRQIQLELYDNTPEGICGNDDCGQISAWYVWSAIGLYPLNPSSGVYIIGSPLVEKATIKLDPRYYKGGSFTIIAHNVSKQYCYIQSAKLNGKPLNRPWLTHDEITQGGRLELEMDLLPNKSWGTDLQP